MSWFNAIKNKPDLFFIRFDIISYYPSITEHLFEEALVYAQTLTDITNDELAILRHTRKQLLTLNGNIWIKQNNNFDVSQGSYDGAEVSELIGLFLLHVVNTQLPEENFGLYRDDGLGVTTKKGPAAAALEKKLHRIFSNHGLKITTSVNIKRTEFLDLVLDLPTGTTAPYRKPQETTIYVNKSSSHPSSVIKRIPEIVSNRLSTLSSSKRDFDNNCQPYKDALKTAGYSNNIEYEKKQENGRSKHRRKRKALWWNPPFSLAVQTNLTKLFFKIIERGIPKNNHLLSKLFNKNSLKISYSCTENIGTVIARHNAKIMKEFNSVDNAMMRECNCQARNPCPLDGHCLVQSVVYRADVTTEHQDEHKFYLGLVSGKFKQRYANHLKSFRHERYKNETTLSTYIWQLKEKGRSPVIKWSVVKRAPSYNPASKKCRLCLMEKFLILEHSNDRNCLNTRTELFSKCRHRAQFLLSAVT